MLERLKQMLMDELEKISKSGSITSTNLDSVCKLTDAIHHLNKIEDRESGYSGGNGEWMSNGYYTNNNGMMYGNGGSRRDSYDNRMGTHYVRGHYSRGADDLMGEIETMMDQVSPNEKETLRRAMDILRK